MCVWGGGGDNISIFMLEVVLCFYSNVSEKLSGTQTNQRAELVVRHYYLHHMSCSQGPTETSHSLFFLWVGTLAWHM